MGLFGPKALTFIHSVARKSLTKGQGSGITKIPGRMEAEAKASEIASRLVDAGLDFNKMDDFIRSEADVVKYLNILDSYKEQQIKAQARIRDRAAEEAIPADSPRGREITEALFGKRGTVVDMKGNVIPEGSGIMGGKSIESLMQSGDVTKGTVTKKSKKVTDREMFREANERLNRPTTVMSVDKRGPGFAGKEYPIDPTFDVNMPFDNAAEKIAEIRMSNQNYITDTISKIKSMDPIDAMKEANKVIKREGPYKNLNQQQAKKILEDTEDHIFERNVTPKETDVPMEETADEVTKAYIDAVRKGKFKGTEDQFRDMIDKMMDEDFASGGRVGYSIGNLVIPENNFMNLGLANLTQGQNTQTAGLLDMFKDTPEEKALEEIQNLRKQENQIKGLGEGAIELKQDELQNIQQKIQDLKNQYPDDESIQQAFDPYADIQGQTAFLDPFTVIGGLMKIKEGAKVSALAKEYFKNKAKEKISKEIYDKVQKKINPPKYPQGPTTKTGGGGGGGGGPPSRTTTKTGGTNPYSGGSGGLHSGMKSSSSPTNVGNPFGYATGGRVGLAGGMTRRAFLKLMGGVAAGIGAVKSGIIGAGKKGVTKKVVKEVVKTPPVNGKPEWFDALVNKVILEGDDVTKKLATKDREIVHTKKINDQESITVTQDLDEGAIRVEYDSPDNMAQEPVMMQFKQGMADETTKGKPNDEFYVGETEPRFIGGPEDADIEFTGESGGPGIEYVASDLTNLKTYATGKGPTMKEFVKSKKRKDLVRKVNDNNYEAAEYLGGKYGDGPEPDFPDDYSGYASGGLAYLLGE